jgi:protoporphyrin/coproporphyrin ferrochelatase
LGSSIGVLLVNLGTPDEPTEDAIRRYLKEFLADPHVVSTPRLLWWFVLRFFILPHRPRELVTSYRAIWESDSPIRTTSRALARQFQELLQARKGEYRVESAMTYGSPTIADALARLKAESIESLVVIPLFPQYSATTTAAAIDKIHQALQKDWRPSQLQFVQSYHEHPLYIDAVSNSISRNWEANGQSEKLILSFHGLPVAQAKKDSYFSQCERSAELIAEKLQLRPTEWILTFQSRRGNQPWLQPYTDETVRKLAEDGLDSVTVACPGFAADCLETLHEIDIEGRQIFYSAGGSEFQYVSALNATSANVDLLLALLSDSLECNGLSY